MPGPTDAAQSFSFGSSGAHGPAARPSLADCQKNALAPAPVALATRIVAEIASAMLEAPTQRGIFPAWVLVGYDGSVTLLDRDRRERGGNATAYFSPERVRGEEGEDVDARSDVFSLGVMLWELLTGTQLFGRATEAATLDAVASDPILDVRSVNPDVPPLVADALEKALARSRHRRFENVTVFANAVTAARASSGIDAATEGDLARWVAEHVPPAGARATVVDPHGAHGAAAARADSSVAMSAARGEPGAVPELDVRGTSRAHRSIPRMAAAQAGPRSSTTMAAVDASPISMSQRNALEPSPPEFPQSSTFVRSASAEAFVATAAPGAAAPSFSEAASFSEDDTDDFEMEIERNLVGGAPMPAASAWATAPGAARDAATQAARAPSAASTSRKPHRALELAAPTRAIVDLAAPAPVRQTEPGSVRWLVGITASLAVTGTAAALFFRFARHAGGYAITTALPQAFDGSSAPESGAVALVSVVVAVVLGFVGLRLAPHAWAIVASGGTMLLFALAMVTVTLASTGDNPTPADGVLLVPYLLPSAAVLLAVGLVARASRLVVRRRGADRLAALPLAAAAGALAFAAVEASPFAP